MARERQREENVAGRKSIRLREYDYSQAGAYFVTIVTHQRERTLGEIRNGVMRLSAAGKIVWDCWDEIPKHFAGVTTDAFVVMPDHVHGVLMFGKREKDLPRKGLINQTLTLETLTGDTRTVETKPAVKNHFPLMRDPDRTLGKVVRFFKARSTKCVRDAGITGFGWHRNYYDHIVRDFDDLERIREYIKTNPARWSETP